MPIKLKHKSIILSNDLSAPLLVACAGETIRVFHIVATCSVVGGGKLTLKTVDTSANQMTNLLNAIPFMMGLPIEFYDGCLEPGDSLLGGYTGEPEDAHITIFYSSEIA